MKNYLPIVKVATGLVAAGLVAGLHALGITLGDADADYYATAFVGLVVAYIVPDPRVQKLSHKLGLREKLRLLNILIDKESHSYAPPKSGQDEVRTSDLMAAYPGQGGTAVKTLVTGDQSSMRGVE